MNNHGETTAVHALAKRIVNSLQERLCFIPYEEVRSDGFYRDLPSFGYGSLTRESSELYKVAFPVDLTSELEDLLKKLSEPGWYYLGLLIHANFKADPDNQAEQLIAYLLAHGFDIVAPDEHGNFVSIFAQSKEDFYDDASDYVDD